MTDNLEIHKVKERIKMNNTKQTQDDRTIQPFNRSTIQRVKAYAFTLAETLIVIGIIGVVAALTLPNLNHATGDKEKVTKVKKIYASLTDAFDRAEAVYGSFDEWFTNINLEPENSFAELSNLFADRILEFMKVSKRCEIGNDSCYMYYDDTPSAILSDGMSLSLGMNGLPEDDNCWIQVDIDGPNKGKNQRGYDWFIFTVKHVNNLPVLIPDYGYPDDYTGRYCNGASDDDDGEYTQVTSGYYTAWVIQNDNMDYLKCPDELNWETQISCK